MLILGLDTSTSAITTALHDGDRLLAQASVEDARAHTERLAPLILEVLAAAGASPRDLTDVAVGTGPGPFTGLRVGLVTAVTMGHALGIPVHGVGSLDALAHGARSRVEGEVLVASDARRKEVYWARYAVSPTSVVAFTSPAVDRPADLTEGLRSLPTIGRGPLLFPDLFPHPVGVLDVAAAHLVDLALVRIAAGEPMPLAPMYLRRPDALTLAERAAP